MRISQAFFFFRLCAIFRAMRTSSLHPRRTYHSSSRSSLLGKEREREGQRTRKKKIPHLFKIHIFRSYILDMRERVTNSCEVRFSTGGDGFHFVVIFFPHLHRFSRSNALSGFDRSRPLHQKVKVACSVLLIA